MARVGMHDAKVHLSTLVERVEAGEDIVIERDGKSVARLVAIVGEQRALASVHGRWRGRLHMAEDFEGLPEDIAEAFGAR
jgi:prevent-host-death family protein